MKYIDVTDDPKPGDLAYHALGHDPREVTLVLDAFVFLQIGDEPMVGPCPRENYTFKREVPDE